jgi:DNA-binding NarL/FixJ family response regulator
MIEQRRIGIVHEHDVLRRGIAGCLEEERSLTLSYVVASDPPREPVDAVIVSQTALLAHTFDCPIVVFDEDVERLAAADSGRVAAALSLGRVTAEQLAVSVRAAAAGLTVSARSEGRRAAVRLDERRLTVLRLLASGASTRTISSQLCYSERTIKSLIREVEYELSASNRAQAVAEAIRQGLI